MAEDRAAKLLELRNQKYQRWLVRRLHRHLWFNSWRRGALIREVPDPNMWVCRHWQTHTHSRSSLHCFLLGVELEYDGVRIEAGPYRRPMFSLADVQVVKNLKEAG